MHPHVKHMAASFLQGIMLVLLVNETPTPVISFAHHAHALDASRRCTRDIMASMHAAQFVREARLRAGLTQRALASRAGVSQPLVARIESGRVQPSFERVLDLVRACGFDLDVRVVPLDEDAWTLAEQGAQLDPDARLDRLLAGVELAQEAQGDG